MEVAVSKPETKLRLEQAKSVFSLFFILGFGNSPPPPNFFSLGRGGGVRMGNEKGVLPHLFWRQLSE